MASNVVLKWHGDQIMRRIRREMAARSRRAARTFANALADNIDEPSPPASVPGQFPHSASGTMLHSIEISYDDDSATVSVGAEYAKFVEKTRPFFQRTLDQVQPKIEKIMSEPLD